MSMISLAHRSSTPGVLELEVTLDSSHCFDAQNFVCPNVPFEHHSVGQGVHIPMR